MTKLYLSAGEDIPSFHVPLKLLFSKKQLTEWFCFIHNHSLPKFPNKFKNVKFKAVKK